MLQGPGPTCYGLSRISSKSIVRGDEIQDYKEAGSNQERLMTDTWREEARGRTVSKLVLDGKWRA